MSTLKNLTICVLMIILIISLPGNAIALAPPELLELQFLTTLSKTEVKPNEKFDLIIGIKNGFLAVDNEFTLFLTEGLTLVADSAPHNLYQPVLTQTFSSTSLSDQQIIIPLLAFQTATDLEGIFIMNQEMVVARLDVPVIGVDHQFRRPLAPTGDYEMPIPPNISCPSEPPLSSIGLAVSDAYNAYYLSNEYTAGSFFTTHTWCNQLAGDWILDVPNVTETTTPTNAEEFYEKTSDLLANTQYTFSISTLQFNTHEASIEEHRLVRQYLAPAVRTLHDNTPTNGTFPLIRIIYSAPPLGFSSDSKQDILADLTAELPDPTIEPWRVSIAVAQVGVMLAVPWNHSKIAVSDYRFAITSLRS